MTGNAGSVGNNPNTSQIGLPRLSCRTHVAAFSHSMPELLTATANSGASCPKAAKCSS